MRAGPCRGAQREERAFQPGVARVGGCAWETFVEVCALAGCGRDARGAITTGAAGSTRKRKKY